MPILSFYLLSLYSVLFFGQVDETVPLSSQPRDSYFTQRGQKREVLSRILSMYSQTTQTVYISEQTFTIVSPRDGDFFHQEPLTLPVINVYTETLIEK